MLLHYDLFINHSQRKEMWYMSLNRINEIQKKILPGRSIMLFTYLYNSSSSLFFKNPLYKNILLKIAFTHLRSILPDFVLNVPYLKKISKDD